MLHVSVAQSSWRGRWSVCLSEVPANSANSVGTCCHRQESRKFTPVTSGATRRGIYAAFVLLWLFPSVALANGISPILNLFHPDRSGAASIVTVVIILVESVLLRWRIPQTRYAVALWRSGLLNLASSIAGSILLLALSRDFYFMGDSMGLVLPLFLITLAIEIPLLHYLYRREFLSWARAGWLIAGVNFLSYGVVFVLEIGLLLGGFVVADKLDQRELANWKEPELLKQVTGRIYATEKSQEGHRLRMFMPERGDWLSLANCPSLDPFKWDVQKNLCAYISWPPVSRRLVICTLPDFSKLHEITPTTFEEKPVESWQDVADLAIAPDGTKLAILFQVGDAVAPKDSASHFSLGSKCRLIVLDIETGQELARSPRWATAPGLCWLPDSKTVLFTSFDDELLYLNRKSDVQGSVGYGVGLARDSRFQQGFYTFDLATGQVRRFSDCHSSWVDATNDGVLVGYESGVRFLDLAGAEQTRISLPRLAGGAMLSPDGHLLLAQIRRRGLLRSGGRLVLIDPKATARRHIIDPAMIYRIDWSDE